LPGKSDRGVARFLGEVIFVLSESIPSPIKLFVGALLIVLTACSEGRGGPIPYDIALGKPDAPTVIPLESGYKIAPLDKLTIKVLKMEDLSGDYNVDLAGNISMPLIGEVRAVNLSTADLDQALTAKLGEKYLENPDVSVGIKESTSRVVTVDGAVKQAGAFPTIGPTSLMRSVALAGGVSDDANAHRVAVFRQIGGQRQAAAFDLVAIRRGQSPDPQIYPGDIIVVDGSGIKQAFKNVMQSFPLLSVFTPF
jgi:polysaccharide export outer membrane protein